MRWAMCNALFLAYLLMSYDVIANAQRAASGGGRDDRSDPPTGNDNAGAADNGGTFEPGEIANVFLEAFHSELSLHASELRGKAGPLGKTIAESVSSRLQQEADGMHDLTESPLVAESVYSLLQIASKVMDTEELHASQYFELLEVR